MPSTVLQNGSVPATTVTLVGLNLGNQNCTGIPVNPLFGNQYVADPMVAVSGAQTSMVVMISPAGPLAAGWGNYTWQAYVPSAGFVAIHICNASVIPVTASANQTFNLRVIQ